MGFSYRPKRRGSELSVLLWLAPLACLLLSSLSCSENNPLVVPDGARPALTSVTPNAAAFGDTHVVVIFEGTGFVPETVALSMSNVLATTFLDTTRLEVLMRDEDLAIPVDVDPPPTQLYRDLSVSNIAVGGGQSNVIRFLVRQPYPVPVVHSISPSEFWTGTDDTVVEIQGENFEYGCTFEWDGEIYPTDGYFGSTMTRALIPEAAFAHGKELTVRVINPVPGGGPSNPVTVVVENPAPVYESHTPFSLIAGQGEQTLTIEGTGFAPDTVILWNGEERETTFLSRREITVTLGAGELATPGKARFSLFTPELGGGQTETVEILFRLDIADHVNYLIYDSGRELIYLAISNEGVDFANSVVSVDPTTGEVVSTLAAGSNPSTLALTEDGHYLYIGFRGDHTVRRIHLSGSEDDLDFPLGEIMIGWIVHAFDIVPMVNAPGSIAVLGYTEEVTSTSLVTIYDDGVPRPNPGPTDGNYFYFWASSIEPTSDPLVLLSCSRSHERSLKEIQIGPEGTIVDNCAFDHYLDESLLDIHVYGDLVYTDAGFVFDEKTLILVGQFDARGPMTIDPDASQAYFLTGTQESVYNSLKVFDLESKQLLGEVPVQQWLEYDKLHLIKVGADGLAFIWRDKTVRLFRDPMFSNE